MTKFPFISNLKKPAYASKRDALELMTLGYRISASSFRGNYSFLNLTLCTVPFSNSTYRCGNYSRAETIRGNTVYEFGHHYKQWVQSIKEAAYVHISILCGWKKSFLYFHSDKKLQI